MNFSDLFQHETGTVSYSAGESIIRTGDSGDRMFVLMQGEAVVRIAGANLYKLHPGELFGEVALIEHTQASADIIAVAECTLVPIDKKRFLLLIQQTPDFALEIMKLIVKRIRLMNGLTR